MASESSRFDSATVPTTNAKLIVITANATHTTADRILIDQNGSGDGGGNTSAHT
jgi:hypothetical protein